MKEICKIKKLRKIYHDTNGETLAVSDFSIAINEGDFIALVGPSGCGKSTILSMLSGVTSVTDGEISFSKDNPVTAYMLQNDTLFPWLTIEGNTLIGVKLKGKDNEYLKHYAKHLIKSYGLEDFKKKLPGSLSGGMKQRVDCIH